MAARSASPPLTETERRRGLVVLGISTFFAWGGFFLVIPIFAVHFVDDLGWAAGTVGALLAIRQFTQQSSTTVFGVLSDRYGPKPLICFGMVLRGLGFAGMAWATSFWTMLAVMVISSIGGGMFEAPRAAATAALAKPEDRQRIYSIFGVIGGLGVAAGTQAGALLIRADFWLVCVAAGASYLVILVVMWVFLPPVRVSVEGGEGGSFRMLGVALRDRTFMTFMLLVSGFWFAWAQFALTVSLAATEIAGTVSAIAWIYLINTIITVGLGFFMPTWLGRWLHPVGLASAGMVVLALGLVLVGFATNTTMMLVAAAVFSLGVITCRPGHETVTASLADPTARGTYFGVAFLSLAIGGGIGNLVGGLAYDFGARNDLRTLPWLLFSAICLLCALGMWINRRAFSEVRDEPGTIEPAPAREEAVAATPVSART